MSQLNPLIQSEARRDERRSQEYQAQTQFPRREKAKSIFQKVLDNAKGSFAGQIVSRMGQELGGVGSAASPFISSQIEREQSFRQTPAGETWQTAQRVLGGTGPLGSSLALTATPITTFLDAAEAVGKVWDAGVIRPLTTAALVTDPTSPLYRGQVYRPGEGGQPGERLQPRNPLEAVGMAWERSESVDLGTAAIANPLLYPAVGPTAPIRAIIDATDIGTYQPWSDESVAEAAENPIHYVVASAINLSPDLFLPPPVRSARIAAQGSAGLRTTIQSAEDLAYLRGAWTEHQARKQAAEFSPFEDIVPGVGAQQAGSPTLPSTQANLSYERSFISDAERYAQLQGKNLDEITDFDLANGIYDMRASELLLENPNFGKGELPGVLTRDDGTYWIDFGKDEVVEAYLRKYYPDLNDSSEIYIYRGARSDEVLGEGAEVGARLGIREPDGFNWWTFDSSLAQGYASAKGGKVLALKIPFRDIKKYNQSGTPGAIGPIARQGAGGYQDEILLSPNLPQEILSRVEIFDAPPPVVSESGNLYSARKMFLEQAEQPQVGAAEGMAPRATKTVEPQDPYSMYIEELAAEKSWGKIFENPLVYNSIGVPRTRLAQIIAKTDDPNMVNELVLASRGDYEAIYNVAAAAPDNVWALGNMNDVVRNAWIEKGYDISPTGQSLVRLNQVYDSAISRDEYFSQVRDLFMTPEGLARGGTTWMPTKSMTVERMRKAGRGIHYAVKQSDYEDAPQWLYKTLNAGNGSPVTTFLQWSSSRQPLGTVSFSGSRPDEWFVELGAQLDSIPIFRGTRDITVGFEPALKGGELVPIRMSASKYRQELTQNLVNEAQDVGILQAWRNMEDRIIRVMADDAGVDVESALAFARGGRQTITEKFGYMAETGGYLFDAQDGRMIIHPKTLSQLLDSFPTLPLDEIYRAMKSEQSLMYRLGSTTQEYTTSAFDAGMKFFRTNVLFKPSYLFKFGALEPLTVTYLAHGTVFADEGFMATMRSFGKNWERRSKRVAYVMGLDRLAKTVSSADQPKTREATQRYLKTLVTERNLTQRALDDALMEMDLIRSGRTSPYKAANGDPLVRAELVEAQLRMNALEDALDNSMPQWREIVEPASYSDVSRKMAEYRAILGDNPEYVSSVREQIAEIERVARARAGSGEVVYTPNENASLIRLEESLARVQWRPKNMDAFRAEVERLQGKMDEVAELSQDFIDPSKRIQELNLALELNEKKIGMAQVQLGEIRRKVESTGFSGYVGSGDGYTTIVVGGQKYQIPSVFSNRQFDFGDALRQEASAAIANKLLYDPSWASAKSVAKWERTADPVRITPDDPLYWDELAWVANSKFRDDPLVGRILNGQSRAQVAEWLATPAGRKYQKTLGIDYLVKRETYSDPVGPLPKIDPTTGERIVPPARRPRVILQSTTELDEMFRLVDQYFPDQELRKRIARGPITPGELQAKLGNNPNLQAIAGDDLIYNPGGKGERALAKMNSALDKIWQFIATNPEDRIARWPFFQREFKRQMELRANVAASQGVRFDPEGEAFKALRQAATRSALDELGKTFYNIRRYNSPTYTARFLTMFPGAVVNSFYRYGRFAVKEPERTAQALILADTILGSGAIDQDGNPAPLGAASYILIPGTKKGEGETGLRVPVESLETLAVAVPALSYVLNIGIASILKNKPEVEDMVLKALGPGLFEELFPYGLPRSIESSLFASYQRNLGTGAAALVRRAMGLEISDEKFLQTSVQFYSNAVAEWEQEGGDPEEAPSFDDAIAGATGYYLQKAFLGWFPPFSVQVRPPGQLWRDAWYDIREQNGGDTVAAREIALKQYGDWFRWYTYSSGDYTAYIPSTLEAYTRIWKDHPALTKKLVSIAGDDLSMVSLLTLGTSGEFSQPVSDFLRDNPLPGDNTTVVSRMTPEKFQNMILVDDGWNVYSTERAKFDAEQARLRTLRDMPDIESGQKELYREMIAENDTRFKAFTEELEGQNRPWAVARTNRGKATADRAALFLREMFADPKFMRSTGRTELFSDIKYFLDQRDVALKAISGTRKNEVKRANREKFLEYVTETFLQENPEFASFFDRYFSSEWVTTDG